MRVSGAEKSNGGDERFAEPARWVADEVARCGGRLRLSASTLLSLFLADRFDAPVGPRIEDALAAEGVRATPGLGAGVRAADEVDLRSIEYREPDAAFESVSNG